MVACTEGDLGALVVTVIGRQNGTTVIREEFTISATNWHPNAQHYLVPARDARDEC